jgi:hypothetical protein
MFQSGVQEQNTLLKQEICALQGELQQAHKKLELFEGELISLLPTTVLTVLYTYRLSTSRTRRKKNS